MKMFKLDRRVGALARFFGLIDQDHDIEANRPNLNGVHVEIEAERFHAVACDGKRMVVVHGEAGGVENLDEVALQPQDGDRPYPNWRSVMERTGDYVEVAVNPRFLGEVLLGLAEICENKRRVYMDDDESEGMTIQTIPADVILSVGVDPNSKIFVRAVDGSAEAVVMPIRKEALRRG